MDEGEVWFGEDAMYRMIKHLERLVEEGKIEENDPIIDLGTGNGVMLRELQDFGFTNLTGIDYATSSIKLAAQICPNLVNHLFQADILKSDERFAGNYRIAMDKGTFDAISLTPNDKEEAIAKYSDNVAQMLRKTGDFLFITRNGFCIDRSSVAECNSNSFSKN